ncbi:hypothetical protein UFOVP568_8 [uncultured Caudovirales phage]|uniref:Uncharacterized protein n=1 Tax=uncultured Caudovirales phage TaxID=2100421 RepID=A0A6J5MWN2_9CAUD|nr:hypothetical protein UFOVP568_8 [uncultured Caudovirales phage]
MYYVGYFDLHGLKLLQASSMSSAARLATSRNNGTPAKWIVRISADDYDGFKRLAKLGWRGSADEFYNELHKMYVEVFD